MKLRLVNFLAFSFIGLLLPNSILISQELFSPVTKKQAWVNLGVGPGKVIDLFEGSALGSFTYAFNRRLVTARYIYSEAIFSDPEGVKPYQFENVTELSLLYGAMTKRRFAFASVAIGFGFVNGEKRNPGGSKNSKIIGIALESQLFLTLPALGFGVYGYSNINPATVTYGFNIAVQMGKLR
ncbi:MAG: hypothetical protein ACXAC5_25385 [Promethearchaeota archaeon]|jgi:hypothetical protein